MALETQSLSICIGDVNVAHQLSLEIKMGECWAVIGRNGVGKSTLLNVLAGLRRAEHGLVMLDGKAIEQWQNRQRAQRLAVLLQDSHEVFPLTVHDAVASGRHPYRQRFAGLMHGDDGVNETAVNQALALMDLLAMQSRSVQTLSGGERRRVAIAAVIAQQTPYLLLDEPVNHLDLHYQIKVLEWVRQSVREQGKAAVMVMHDLNLAWRYCNKAILLYGDGEVECGELTKLLDETRLWKLYAHPIARIEAQGEVMFVPKVSFGLSSGNS